jgi:hypothetical protein
LIDFGLLVLEKKIFKNVLCIFTLSLLSPLGEGLSPSFKDTSILSLQGLFMPSLVKIGPVVLEKDPTPFLHFCDYLPFEEDLALYLNKLESLHPRIICTKFD